VAWSFQTKPEFLLDPSVWIANTWSMVHNTPHMVGMQNVRTADEADDITMRASQKRLQRLEISAV